MNASRDRRRAPRADVGAARHERHPSRATSSATSTTRSRGGGLVPVASGQGHDGAVSIHQRDAVLFVGRLEPRRRGGRARCAARARVRRGRRRAPRRRRRSRPATRCASPTRARTRSSRVRAARKCWSGSRRERRRRRLVGAARPARRATSGWPKRPTASSWRSSRAHPRAAGRRARRPGRRGAIRSSSGSTSPSRSPAGSSTTRGYRRRRRPVGRRRRRRRTLAARVRATVLGAARPPAPGRPGAVPPDRGERRRGRRDPAEVDVPDRWRGQRRDRLGARLPGAGPPPGRRVRDLAVRRRPPLRRSRSRSIPARSPARW